MYDDITCEILCYIPTCIYQFIFNYREYHCRSTEAQAGWFSAFASMVINFFVTNCDEIILLISGWG